ncbi:hypothetical protein ENKNEFLB_02838 [Nocardioides aquaticus]|uniref:Uncharacterized protein n=3 Tax=Actinomycetes TaxID=1760 RepID=A0ABN1TFV7_9ACTN|nr:hypothetical protein ENKNEFLB_02838 [Nocardioides aquaticus]
MIQLGVGNAKLTDLDHPDIARRTKVTHYYVAAQARLAESVGLPTPYLCGRYSKRVTSPRTQRDLPVVGGLMVVSKSRDCKVCLRRAEAGLQDS